MGRRRVPREDRRDTAGSAGPNTGCPRLEIGHLEVRLERPHRPDRAPAVARPPELAQGGRARATASLACPPQALGWAGGLVVRVRDFGDRSAPCAPNRHAAGTEVSRSRVRRRGRIRIGSRWPEAHGCSVGCPIPDADPNRVGMDVAVYHRGTLHVRPAVRSGDEPRETRAASTESAVRVVKSEVPSRYG